MPAAAPRPCNHPGCRALIKTGNRCEAHKQAWATSTGKPTPRIRGRKLQRLRAELFQRHPLCQECERQGRVSPAFIRDHIVNLAEGGPDDDSNVQALCQACSDAKTARESARGKTRAAGGVFPGKSWP